MQDRFTLHLGDCLESLKAMPDKSVQMCVTSPPYFGLRDYGHEGQIGLEETPEEFIAKLVAVFREVRRVLRDDGTLWVNIGDSYAREPAKGGSGPGGKNGAYSNSYTEAQAALHAQGSSDGVVGRRPRNPTRLRGGDGLKPKDLIGIPWMLAFALRADGWFLRQDIIWHKPNPMPESVRDRCTKAHEYVFLLSKSERYLYDGDAIREPAVGAPAGNTSTPKGAGDGSADDKHRTRGGLTKYAEKIRAKGGQEMRNRRSVWTVPTRPYRGAHFATFPPELIEPCILAGSRIGDVVLDPFGGSGTTAQVALGLGRAAVLCELNPDYEPLIRERVFLAGGPKRATKKPRAERREQLDIFTGLELA